jgi:hypothetical protein
MHKSSERDGNYMEDPGEDPGEAAGNRAFGCTIGGILMAIAAAKAWMAAALTLTLSGLLGIGALLVLLAIAAPTRLTRFRRLWLRFGAAIEAVANPVMMALLFALVVTPMAVVMRLAGKRPLRLLPDPAARSYWIAREKQDGEKTSMRQQF